MFAESSIRGSEAKILENTNRNVANANNNPYLLQNLMNPASI